MCSAADVCTYHFVGFLWALTRKCISVKGGSRIFGQGVQMLVGGGFDLINLPNFS